MRAEIYRLFIGYEGIEDKIWRLADVSSNKRHLNWQHKPVECLNTQTRS